MSLSLLDRITDTLEKGYNYVFESDAFKGTQLNGYNVQIYSSTNCVRVIYGRVGMVNESFTQYTINARGAMNLVAEMTDSNLFEVKTNGEFSRLAYCHDATKCAAEREGLGLPLLN